MKRKSKVADRVHELVREGFVHDFEKPSVRAREDGEWKKVTALGTRLWLDTGDVDEASKLWNVEFEALTTNNTLLNKEVQKGFYDEWIGRAAKVIRAADPSLDEDDLVLEIAFVLNARHGLKLVETFDAHVSVELHTDLADDEARTVAYGKRFYAICPERFYVKVPLTAAGYLAARKLTAAGVPLNFTLGFSARQNLVAALVSQPRFVNVFMGRLNAFVADHKLGDGQNVGEKATLATQRVLRRLREDGRTGSLLIGASMREGSQVASLAGLDVFTMPPKVAADYRAHPARELLSRIDEDPEVTTAEGVRLEDFYGASLWAVTPEFERCVEALLAKDLVGLGAESLQAHFERAGFPDFLPRWSEADVAMASADGKIPVYAHWRDRLASGSVGLDALMNLSAFRSFASDQKALDDRIRSLL